MAIVSLLLLLACTNLTSLLLARGAARQHEMAVRVCLGAGRLRLLRQVLTESLLLSVAGSLLGIVLAHFGANTLAHIVASGRAVPGFTAHIEIPFRPDLHVLLFTGGVALLAGLLFGLLPAMRALRTVPASALQHSARIGETRSRRFFAKSLVVTQVALSVVLLSAAGLFLGYLSSLRNLDLGFRRDHLLLVSLDRTHSGYQNAQLSRLCQELLGRLQRIPGVRSATLSGATPISGGAAAGYATAEGHQERPEDRRYIQISTVAPNYFETYGIPFLAGREFSAQDQGGPRVAIINQAMARYYFGERNAVGKLVTLDHATWHGDDNTYEIVGIVRDSKHNQIREVAPRTIYLDVFQDERVVSQLTLRTMVAPEAMASEVRRTVGKLLPTVPIARLTTMADQIDESLVPERLIATLSGVFGALGVLLAAIGLYGLLAYTVARRVNEIGVRMALGASRSDVARMVLRDALTMVCTGLVIGAPLAFWGKSLVASLIEDLPVRSMVPIVFGAAAMIAVALLAAYLPARRAARVDPILALRYE
jgi:predicted permease